MRDDAESAVRRYLVFLKDPSTLVDGAKVRELQARADAAEDPIERLRATAALHKARNPDASGVRDGFVRHAREWAESNGIPVSAFREFGIPADVLRAAGLGPAATHPRRRRRNGTSKRKTMTAGALEQALLGRSGEF